MQTIELEDAQYLKIREQAAAAGYQEVGAYLETLADDAAFDPRCGMSEAEMRESAAHCDSIAKRMEVGQERDAHEALTELGNKFGFVTRK